MFVTLVGGGAVGVVMLRGRPDSQSQDDDCGLPLLPDSPESLSKLPSDMLWTNVSVSESSPSSTSRLSLWGLHNNTELSIVRLFSSRYSIICIRSRFCVYLAGSAPPRVGEIHVRILLELVFQDHSEG